MQLTLAANIECALYLDRLREFISLTDACNYLEIHTLDLRAIKRLEGSDQYKPEAYHLKKIKYLKATFSDRPDLLKYLI
jgi:hypothetical protein